MDKIRDSIIVNQFPSLLRRTVKAIKDYKMINQGDRVLVAVSGGKDSISMMHLLDYLSRREAFDFKLIVCNVNLGCNCTHTRLLKEYFQHYGFSYLFLQRDVLGVKRREDLNCFWCSWNRRKALFEAARKYDCNKLALGHHLDDVVHTTLMNMFFYGEVSTAIPYLELFGGEIVLIRPLCYIHEYETREFTKVLNAPLSRCICPHDQTSKRAFIKNIFAPLFNNFPLLKNNIFTALKT